jgi:hypothetical protein
MPGKKYRSIKGSKKQYESIKKSLIKRGKPAATAKRIAAATVNKRAKKK